MTDPGKAVFLSYASQDASIRRQIKTCALFIWKLAVDRSHLMASDLPFLLPFIVDETPDQEDRVPDRFREVQWTRLPGGVTTPAFVERIRLLLTLDATTPTTTTLLPSVPATHSADPTSKRSTPRAPRPYLPWIVGSVVILATAYIFADKFMATKHFMPLEQEPAKTPAQTEAVSEKSLAVLPFVDMSEKKDQEYFSDGLSEEITNQLAKIPELKVSGRISSFQYKGMHLAASEIGKQLGVSAILDGSVRKSGESIRVSAQLVRVSDGFQLWSDSYDAGLTDIFKIQDNISENVIRSLQVHLLSSALT